jgi:hypothetical protein
VGAAEFGGVDEAAGPDATAIETGVGERDGVFEVGDCVPCPDDRVAQITVAYRAVGQRPAVLVPPVAGAACLALDDEVAEEVTRLPAAGPVLPFPRARLGVFDRVEAEEPDAGLADGQRVAIDRAGLPDQGGGRGENQGGEAGNQGDCGQGCDGPERTAPRAASGPARAAHFTPP